MPGKGLALLDEVTPERWHQIKGVLDRVLRLPRSQRIAALEQPCGDDPALRRAVEHFLRYASESFHDGATSDATAGDGLASDDPHRGRRIGPYRLIRQLGEGGMGAVYLAERQDLPKRVAIKLIRPGLAGLGRLAERFRNEEQILARLEHPHIAQLLDAGTTDDGLAYFVMERVDGEPLGRYCAARRLSVSDRLELFLKICSAVGYAHQNRVVHRDLKPDNVLVTADGLPKLLDFGIAKWLDAETTDPITRGGLGPMTLAYASPEQVQGEPISPASDVYSLGVVLYELLTGIHPFRGDATPIRAICEQDPPRPSIALRQLAGTDDSARTPRRLRRRVAGDLDSVVLKAMHKDPRERYRSVERLADDIRRHLSGVPVEARGGKLAYRSGKLIRRHLLAWVTAASCLLTVSSGVAAVTLWQQAEREKERAEACFRKAREMRSRLGQRPSSSSVIALSRGWDDTTLAQLEKGENTCSPLIALCDQTH